MSPDFPRNIYVEFDEYTAHVPYAAELAQLLGSALIVFTETERRDSAEEQMIRRRIRTAVQKNWENPERVPLFVHTESLPLDELSPRDLLVSSRTLQRNTNILSPGVEHRVFRTTPGPIFVPLGDREREVVIATCAARLAKRMETSLVFWHTTWKNPAVSADDPNMHISWGAGRLLAEARKVAMNEGVKATTIVECADTVVEGMIRAALICGASLIVMARGKHKVLGAYPDRVRARNCPIPLLILGQEE